MGKQLTAEKLRRFVKDKIRAHKKVSDDTNLPQNCRDMALGAALAYDDVAKFIDNNEYDA